MIEIWRNIKDYDGLYQVSNRGRVKRLTSIVRNCNGYINLPERILKLYKKPDGYLSVRVSKKSKTKQFLVHRLVAAAFIANKDNKRCINHIDGNKENNRIGNLEWCTHLENMAHACKLGINARGEKNGQSKLKDADVAFIRRMIKTDQYSYADIGRLYGQTRNTISRIANNHTYKHIKV